MALIVQKYGGTSVGDAQRIKAVAERVIAYLHHSSLDPAKHEYFMPPESNKDFFTTSTFTPPPEEAGAGAKP